MPVFLFTYLIECFCCLCAGHLGGFHVEEWVNDARNKARLADNLHAEANKSFAVTEGRNKKLALKLATMDRDRRSAKAGLISIEA